MNIQNFDFHLLDDPSRDMKWWSQDAPNDIIHRDIIGFVRFWSDTDFYLDTKIEWKINPSKF